MKTMKTMGAGSAARAAGRRGAVLALAVAAAIAGAPQLRGQGDVWSRWGYGFQLGLLAPMGETLRAVAEPGVGAAGYLEKVWSNGWVMRGRLEHTFFGEKDLGFGLKAQQKQTGAMLDVVYYSRHSEYYPFVGLGYFIRQRNAYLGSDQTVFYRLTSDLALSLGGGWNFTNHFGLEAKYSYCFLRGTQSSWAQASVLYRF